MSREEMLNECVSRDKAIVQLNHLKSDWDDDWNIAIRKCIETIKKLPSVTAQPRWIPVSERLPNFAGVYLVTRYFSNNVMNPTYLVDACFFDGTDTWHNDNRINHDRKYLTNVVAWLEEPEPYKASPTGAESEG